MSFSSGIVSSIGISLGDLEIATDYLFANPEFYEPDLTEVKNTISNKSINTIQRITKPVKPKITKESVINKFSIVPVNKIVIADEIVETTAVIIDNSSFDFSFDDMDTQQSELDDAMDEANLLMQRLAMTNIATELTIDNNDYLDSESDDIEIDINDESIDIEDDGFDIDEDDFDIEEDSIDIDEDDFDIEDDNFDIDEDDFDIEEDSINIEDNISIDVEDSHTNKNNNSNFNTSNDVDIDTEDDEDFELDIEDDEDFELDIEDNEDFELDIEDTEDFEIDIEDAIEDIDNINDDVYELDAEEDNQIVQNVISKPIINTIVQNNSQSQEIEELKKRVADAELAMQRMLNDKSSHDTSNINKNNNFEEVDSIDSLVGKATKSNKTQECYNEYSLMTIDMLFKHVKSYMTEMGVNKRTVDMSALNNKFGETNIKKLIQKSYLIKIGKGVTTGR